jgi:NAD-dependent deacetylase
MRAMSTIRNIVILTGAGVSAESGIDTFRGGGGLWEQHRVEDVATPEAFARDPDLVLRFYDMRRASIQEKQPNAAHFALARLDAEWPGELLIVTQNVDDLHERAGARRVLHMHGEHLNAWCTACGTRSKWTAPLIDRPPCPACGARALRPDVVWFGEMPYRMDEIYAALRAADLFVSIGTSGAVYPAAGFVRDARELGARTLELNLERSEGSAWFDESRLGPASELVPAWVEETLARCEPQARHSGSLAMRIVRIAGARPSSKCNEPHSGSPMPGAASTRTAWSAANVPVHPAIAPSIPSSAQVSQSSASNASPTKQR